MNITKITKDNALSFTDLSEESLAEADTLAGVGCVDDNGDPIGAALVDSDGERLLISSIRVNDDSVFVENFAKNMKFLQQAEMLLDYYHTEEGQQAFGQNEEIASKLYWMVNIKAAYMERITIISSPYYVSMREEDFTPKTRAHMEKELKK